MLKRNAMKTEIVRMIGMLMVLCFCVMTIVPAIAEESVGPSARDEMFEVPESRSASGYDISKLDVGEMPEALAKSLGDEKLERAVGVAWDDAEIMVKGVRLSERTRCGTISTLTRIILPRRTIGQLIWGCPARTR